MISNLKSSDIEQVDLSRKAFNPVKRKEFTMKLQNGMTLDDLDTFTRAYIECALWSSLDDETLLDQDHDITSISKECLTAMIADCAKFQTENMDMIINDLSQAGHDFWLTRNHHGAGFWDGEYPRNGDVLTAKSHEYGKCDLYIGDDGLIYC